MLFDRLLLLEGIRRDRDGLRRIDRKDCKRWPDDVAGSIDLDRKQRSRGQGRLLAIEFDDPVDQRRVLARGHWLVEMGSAITDDAPALVPEDRRRAGRILVDQAFTDV